MSASRRLRSLRTRLLVFIGLTLAAVCAAMALTTVFVQRAYLLGNLDERVGNAAERSLGGARLHPELSDDLSFLMESGHPTGMLAARLDADGDVSSAEVVRQDAPPRALTAAQRTALAGVGTDGAMHTATVPGLGTYRSTGARSAPSPVSRPRTPTPPARQARSAPPSTA